MSLAVFKEGIHLPYYKELTSQKPTRPAGLPEEIIIPLQQHAGAPCEPLVQVGERVVAGQKIGHSEKFLSAPVHASLTGVVTAIEPRPNFTGEKINSIVIKVDREQEPAVFGPPRDLDSLSREEIITAITEAGIVGMGGAAFPTSVKLNPAKPVDTVILNGCECEPYLTCNHRLMLEQPDKLVAGAKLLLKALGVQKCYFGIEDNKSDAINLIRQHIDDTRIEVVSLPTKYPQGSEKHLIKVVMDREVPSGGLPFDVGVLVQNVATTFAIYEAAVLNKPLIDRIVTVTGQNIVEPGNLLVKIGTPIQQLIDECGGLKEGFTKVLLGGPMTGFSQADLSVPVVKSTNGVVLLPSQKEAQETDTHNCVRCGRCVRFCPMLLYPNYISTCVELDNYGEAERWDALDCMQCGTCSYVCLAKRPTVNLIKKAKTEIMVRRHKK
ncbi:MAG: electron transport complex subunit RsxC [Dethiobacter sp.]|jgi:electron transport complex protein RnfC|nr:electron transport complex subunit RsxC [Dethiobacter sp.]